MTVTPEMTKKEELSHIEQRDKKGNKDEQFQVMTRIESSSRVSKSI